MAKELLEQIETVDTEALEKKFNELEESIEQSSDPLEEGRQFLRSFLQEIASRYGVFLTLPEACQLVKANLHQLEIPLEAQESLLAVIELLLSEPITATFSEQPEFKNSGIQKSWSLKGKKQKKKKPNLPQVLAQLGTSDSELPANVYVGGVEMLAGALICVIPHPVAWHVGGALVLDGGRRVVDGYIQASDESRLDRRQHPNEPEAYRTNR